MDRIAFIVIGASFADGEGTFIVSDLDTETNYQFATIEEAEELRTFMDKTFSGRCLYQVVQISLPDSIDYNTFNIDEDEEEPT